MWIILLEYNIVRREEWNKSTSDEFNSDCCAVSFGLLKRAVCLVFGSLSRVFRPGISPFAHYPDRLQKALASHPVLGAERDNFSLRLPN